MSELRKADASAEDAARGIKDQQHKTTLNPSDSPSKSPAEVEACEFLTALRGAAPIPDDERVILNAFRGDPTAENVPRKWRPLRWLPGRALPVADMDRNVYVCVSLARRDPVDGWWHRRTIDCAAGLTLMVDDVGTKVSPEFMRGAPPSAVIETSPGNYQVHYFFAEPQRDMRAFDVLIQSFIATHSHGQRDPGMAGVNRVARVPGALNMKAKYGGAFRVRTVLLEPGRRWRPGELVKALRIDRLSIPRVRPTMDVPDEEARARVAEFEWVAAWLDQKDLFLGSRGRRGWADVHCPWRGEHSERAGTGAAIGEPREENGWYGAFQCHHGACARRTWRHFVRWVEEMRGEDYEEHLARQLNLAAVRDEYGELLVRREVAL